jgi:hypothetical protein
VSKPRGTIDSNDRLLKQLTGCWSNLVPETHIFDVKTEDKLLIMRYLVGERGFEPPTPLVPNQQPMY